MHERGQVPYGNHDALEQYCYREISNCEIVVNVVGGRFGSTSGSDEQYSVSQMELKTAQKLNRQVYVFVDKSVHVEYGTWLKNSGSKDFKPSYVDDVRVYNFLKEINGMKANNVLFGFESTKDIIEFLREQWAGLFQRFLQQESRNEEYKISANLKATADTLSQIIEYTTRERDDALRTVLISSHPVFGQIKEKMGISIRVYFTTFAEMQDFFKTFGYIDITPGNDDEWYHFYRELKKKQHTVFVAKEVFDDEGKVKPVENGRWSEDFADVETKDAPVEEDVPF